MPYIGQGSDGFGIRRRYFFTASAGDTSLSGNDSNGLALKFSDGSLVDVYLNGVLLDPNSDYNTTTANTIGSLASLAANDFLEVVVYDVFAIGDAVSQASGGTFASSISVTGNITATEGMTSRSEDVFNNRRIQINASTYAQIKDFADNAFRTTDDPSQRPNRGDVFGNISVQKAFEILKGMSEAEYKDLFE